MKFKALQEYLALYSIFICIYKFYELFPNYYTVDLFIKCSNTIQIKFETYLKI